MILLTEYYKSTNQQRDQEYLFCLKQNLKVDMFTKLYIFISDDSVLDLDSDKIEVVKLEKRPTYKDLLVFCNQFQDEICVITNTDIFFDESLEHLKDYNFDNKFISLTRWDIVYDKEVWKMRYYDLPWRNNWTTAQFSQDSWLFKTPVKVDDRTDFTMGRAGCDNRISQIFHELGYSVVNPSKKIITKHFHQSNHRTYDPTETITGPYLLISPTDDLNQETKLLTIPHF
jgi:hypothetical protein